MTPEIDRLRKDLAASRAAGEKYAVITTQAAADAALALARIGELAIAAQKSTDYYGNESTIQPSEEDWRIDGTEEHKLWNAMESDIAALRAAINAHLSSPNSKNEPRP